MKKYLFESIYCVSVLLMVLNFVCPSTVDAVIVEKWRSGRAFMEGDDMINAMALDPSQNPIVTGSVYSSTSGLDFLTIKFNGTAGSIIWESYHDELGYDDVPNAIAVDSFGDVYVTGYVDTSAILGLKDYYTVKYDGGSGAEIWSQKYDYSTGNDVANAIALDSSGDVFVTGYSASTSNGLDILTIKYDKGTGIELWRTRYNGSANQNDVGNAIAVDSIGNVYVTGYSTAMLPMSITNIQYTTIKYDGGSGTQLWVNHYNSPLLTNGDDIANDIAVSSINRIYVTGESESVSTGLGFATHKYRSSGSKSWTTRYDTADEDKAIAIAVDAAENVYVTGESKSSAGTGITTIKYDSAGTELWVQNIPPISLLSNYHPNAMAVDSSGRVYVTGYRTSLISSTDWFTVIYDTDGTKLWSRTFNGSGNSTDVAQAIAVDNYGSFYVAGYETHSFYFKDFFIIKYSEATIPVLKGTGIYLCIIGLCLVVLYYVVKSW